MLSRILAALFVLTLALSPASLSAREVKADFDTDDPFVLTSQWDRAEHVPGVTGEAWRSDGFSSYLTLPARFEGERFIGAAMWVALESYPSDREVPTAEIMRSSFLQQSDGRRGFDLWVDTYGRWGATLAVGSKRIDLRIDAAFPLYRWSHVGFSYDPVTGEASLFLDRRRVTTQALGDAAPWSPAQADLTVARPYRIAEMLNFEVNLLNGAFDDIVVTQDPERWRDVLARREAFPASVESSLAVPSSRFERDFLRPRYHAMPPANWTNEPHGLVLVDGRYHLFYQRTPNGPFKTQMVWGHMSSADLVDWTHHRDALRPSLQIDAFGFDMKGIWSGDVIRDGEAAYAYYTSVNHGPREAFNPGISVAVSTDPMLRVWEKRGPIIDTRHVNDFRDPYLWQEDGIWHMIVGAAYDAGGGLDYYRCGSRKTPTCWEHIKRFASIPYARMDVGSIIWEMPVFEAIGDRRLLIVNPIGGNVSKYGTPATRGVYWLGGWRNGMFEPDRAEPRMLDLFPGHLSPAVARLPDGGLAGIGIVDERRTSQAQEDAGWAHVFSLPREYYLNAAGMLGQRPLAALSQLRTGEPIQASVREAGESRLASPGHQYEAELTFEGAREKPFGLVLGQSADRREATRIVYDPATRQLILDKSRSSLRGEDEGPEVIRQAYDLAAFGPPDKWHVFVDGSIVDVFIGDGGAFSFRLYPKGADSTGISVLNDDGGAVGAAIWRLRPAAFDYDFSEGTGAIPGQAD